MRRTLPSVIFVGPLLLRLVVGCGGDDRSDDPRFAPYLAARTELATCTPLEGGRARLEVRLAGELRRKTYTCERDETVGSCSPDSRDPDAPCRSVNKDFGPQWGEAVVRDDLPTRDVRATICTDDGDCRTEDVDASGVRPSLTIDLSRLERCVHLEATVMDADGREGRVTASACCYGSSLPISDDAGTRGDAADSGDGGDA